MSSPSSSTSKWPIVLYIPNLMCYLRIILAFIGLYYSLLQQQITTPQGTITIRIATSTDTEATQHNPSPDVILKAIYIWLFSQSLDFFDGIIARKLNQCSNVGILLDIIADNILRTTTWIAAIIISSASLCISDTSNPSTSSFFFFGGAYYNIIIIIVGTFIICIEWITLLCTQLHSKEGGGKHWKSNRENDPWFIRQVFKNNFKNPLGSLVLYGLYGSSLFVYGSNYYILYNHIPYFDLLKYTAYIGRCLAMFVEVYLCSNYFQLQLQISSVKEKEDEDETTTTTTTTDNNKKKE